MRGRSVRARAPTRIDIAGGFTDVPPYCDRRGGLVVNAAIRPLVEVEVRETGGPGFLVESGGAVLRIPSTAALDPRGRERLVQGALLATGARKGLEIRIRSAVPPGSGLGTSGATGVALLAALDAVAGRRRGPALLAREAHRIEVEVCGHRGGGQDQVAAACGGFLSIRFDGPDGEARPIPLPSSFLRELRSRCVLVYTGIPRISGRLIEGVMGRFLRGERTTCAALDALAACARAARRALRAGDVEALAEAVGRNWEAEKQLHPAITNARIERLFAAAARGGAIGGKALGAGGGGCLLFLAADGRRRGLREALRRAGARTLRFDFEGRGVRV
ncbi:MAG: GHMP kinase [Planctomycetes bacterium]|nr:GHMP kinase [Planctomycetota bacterium]